mgnify:CR=1 FL=1
MLNLPEYCLVTLNTGYPDMVNTARLQNLSYKFPQHKRYNCRQLLPYILTGKWVSSEH